MLAMLAQGPAHGFALARRLGPDGDIGRIYMVRRPLVYRALDRLIELGLAEEERTEPGAAGPKRQVIAITTAGRRRSTRWLYEPVEHIRDLRLEFLVKIRLLAQSRRDPHRLIDAQRQVLKPVVDQLTQGAPSGRSRDVVDLWRRHQAQAAWDFLSHLANDPHYQ